MSDKKSTTLMPKVQHPERTQKFVSVIAEALEAFEDNIGSLEENTQASAYETFINSYKDALSRIWRPAAAADTKLILKTIRQTTSITHRDGQMIGTATAHSQSIPRKAKDSRFGNLDINA